MSRWLSLMRRTNETAQLSTLHIHTHTAPSSKLRRRDVKD